MPHLQDLDVEFVSLVDRAAVRDSSHQTEPQKFILWKSESGNNNPNGGDMPTNEELTAALEKAGQERDEAQANLAKAEKKLAKQSKKDEEPEQINKDELPQAVREALEKAEARAEKLEKKAAEDAKIAKQERDLRLTREFVAKAETEFPNVGGDAGEFGPMLKAMSETLSEDVYKAVETRLRAAEEQVRTSNLFKELGQGGDPTPGANAEIEAATRKADELRKADPALTPYDAMRLAMSRDQQAAYLASVR